MASPKIECGTIYVDRPRGGPPYPGAMVAVEWGELDEDEKDRLAEQLALEEGIDVEEAREQLEEEYG